MSFEERLAGAVREAVRDAYGVELDSVHVERPNDPSHGDFATNVALANARVLKRNPREVAENLVEALDTPLVAKAEVAGPGFVNFWLTPEALWQGVGTVLGEGRRYGREEPSGDPMQLEFVSANPTGPMTVAHGRHAAYGDSLARILEAAGRVVSREYYFNDGGNQIRLLGESVAARYAGLYEREWPVSDPDALYRGEYVGEIARALAKEHGDRYLDMPPEKALPEIGAFATSWCMEDIKKTLARARVHFDTYFNEKSLYESGAVEEVIEELKRRGHVYESEGRCGSRPPGSGTTRTGCSSSGTAPTPTWPLTSLITATSGSAVSGPRWTCSERTTRVIRRASGPGSWLWGCRRTSSTWS